MFRRLQLTCAESSGSLRVSQSRAVRDDGSLFPTDELLKDYQRRTPG